MDAENHKLHAHAHEENQLFVVDIDFSNYLQHKFLPYLTFLLDLKHIVLKFISQCPQPFLLYRAAVLAVLWKYGHTLLAVELVAFLPHLVTQVTFLTHLLVFHPYDLIVFA